jgi:hypothetical protein
MKRNAACEVIVHGQFKSDHRLCVRNCRREAFASLSTRMPLHPHSSIHTNSSVNTARCTIMNRAQEMEGKLHSTVVRCSDKSERSESEPTPLPCCSCCAFWLLTRALLAALACGAGGPSAFERLHCANLISFKLVVDCHVDAQTRFRSHSHVCSPAEGREEAQGHTNRRAGQGDVNRESTERSYC